MTDFDLVRNAGFIRHGKANPVILDVISIDVFGLPPIYDLAANNRLHRCE